MSSAISPGGRSARIVELALRHQASVELLVESRTGASGKAVAIDRHTAAPG
jgi:hypothetical protein